MSHWMIESALDVAQYYPYMALFIGLVTGTGIIYSWITLSKKYGKNIEGEEE